jgi:hypothetical protein
MLVAYKIRSSFMREENIKLFHSFLEKVSSIVLDQIELNTEKGAKENEQAKQRRKGNEE